MAAAAERVRLFNDRPQVNIAQLQQTVDEEIQTEYKNEMVYKVQETTHRIILCIGRSRTGKTTLKRMLTDPKYITEQLMTDAGTDEPSLSSVFISSKKMVLDIIDTPGPYERRTFRNKNKKKDQATILKLIADCVNMEITKIHLFCFVASYQAFESHNSGDDLVTLENLIKYFGPDIAENSCLIITRCESKGEEELEATTNSINSHAEYASIKDFFKKGIFYSGALNGGDWRTNPEKLRNQFENVCNLRKKLIDFFSSKIDPYELKHTQISESRRINNELKITRFAAGCLGVALLSIFFWKRTRNS